MKLIFSTFFSSVRLRLNISEVNCGSCGKSKSSSVGSMFMKEWKKKHSCTLSKTPVDNIRGDY